MLLVKILFGKYTNLPLIAYRKQPNYLTTKLVYLFQNNLNRWKSINRTQHFFFDIISFLENEIFVNLVFAARLFSKRTFHFYRYTYFAAVILSVLGFVHLLRIISFLFLSQSGTFNYTNLFCILFASYLMFQFDFNVTFF